MRSLPPLAKDPGRFVRHAAALLFAFVPLAACGAGAANYPDRPDIAQAQGGWCEALAKSEGSGPAWEHMKECRGANTAASAAYLRGMTKCFFGRVSEAQAGGDTASVDRSQMLGECNDKILFDLPEGGPGVEEVLDARCQRAERCEKTAYAECKAAVKRLEPAQQALFTSMYNDAALHDIAGCLSSGCSDNEEEARDACYKKFADKLLWFP